MEGKPIGTGNNLSGVVITPLVIVPVPFLFAQKEGGEGCARSVRGVYNQVA